MGYEITWLHNGAIKRFQGHVTGSDILNSVIEIEQDSRFDNLRYVINDFLPAQGGSFGDVDIHEIAAIDKAAAASNPSILIAVVATRPEIVEAARQYADSPLNAYPTRIFADLASAERWLGEMLKSGKNITLTLPGQQ